MRWPDSEAGPLWAGVHLHERAGVMAVVGVELFSEEPLDARIDPGPESGILNGELLPHAPLSVRAADVEGLSLHALVTAWGMSSGELVDQAKRYTLDHWRAVAHCVLATRAAGNHRTAMAVASTWHVSHSTAKAWIARARREGLLPRP
jgi:hypothetical protein